MKILLGTVDYVIDVIATDTIKRVCPATRGRLLRLAGYLADFVDRAGYDYHATIKDIVREIADNEDFGVGINSAGQLLLTAFDDFADRGDQWLEYDCRPGSNVGEVYIDFRDGTGSIECSGATLVGTAEALERVARFIRFTPGTIDSVCFDEGKIY